MNQTFFTGRFTRDPELRQTLKGEPVLHFTLAVQRRRAKENTEEITDFIPCVAWNGRAEKIAKMGKKSKSIFVSGIMTSRDMMQEDGSRSRRLEMRVDSFSFLESARFVAAEE